MVVDGNHRVLIFFTERAHYVVGTLLHLCIGTLHSIQLHAIAVATSIYGRYRTTTQADAIVVTTQHHNLVSWLRLSLQTVTLGAIAHAACQHDDLIVAIHFITFLVLEGEQRTADQRLSELVAKVAGTIGGLDKNLLRRLIQPLAHGQDIFPSTPLICAWIAGHVDGCTCNRPRALTTTHTVANLTASTCRGTIEWLHGCGEVVSLCLQRNHALNVLHFIEVWFRVVCRSELLNDRPLCKGHIIFIGRDNLVRMFLCRLLDELEE